MSDPVTEPAAPAPPPVEPTLPLSATAAQRASGWSRAAASIVDVAVLALLPALPRLLAALAQRVPAGAPHRRWTWVGLGLAGAFLLAQAVLASARGRTLGRYVAGIAVADRAGGGPGFRRGLFRRTLLPVAGAFTLGCLAWKPALYLAVDKLPPLGLWMREHPAEGLLLCGAAGALLWLVVDRISLFLPGGRTFGDRLGGTVVVLRGGEERRAYAPPSFASKGFVLSVLGLFAAGAAFGVARWFLSSVVPVEATDLDIPTLAGAAAAALVLCAAGALASFSARRLLVGELALVALLAAALAFEAMALGLVRVPAMQRFDIAGWLDWGVYAVAGYFAVVVVLVIGSALGFMVAGDEGADPSLGFEWMVARRHLRLRLFHYLGLAGSATLVVVLVYGVLVWPVRATWRLLRRRPVPAPLPPTVFMSLLTVVGVMFGVMSLVVVLSVMGGFERDLKEKILGTNAHGVIHRFVGDFTEWREVSGKVRGVEGVRGVTPFILSEVMLTTDQSVTGAVLKGIDVDTVGQVTDLEKNIDPDAGRLSDLVYPDRIPKGPPPLSPRDLEFEKGRGGDGQAQGGSATGEQPDEPVLPGIVIGREMARGLRVWVGDKVTVMNPLGELGPQGPVPRSRVFRVAAIFYSGMYEYDSKFAYIQLREAQRFFRMGDSVSGLELRFANVDEARPLMKRILGALEGFPYRGKDWGEMNKNLFSALRLERVVMFILLSFQVLIACICVIATLVMLVVEKRREVATLKAMGAREGGIMKLFVIEGLAIGGIGTAYGLAGGYMFCKVIETWGVNLDPEVYYITHLPVVIDPLSFLSVAIVSMVLVFVATIYPARRGGSVAPVEGFRDE